jgi:SAM-dependent methyltransferase
MSDAELTFTGERLHPGDALFGVDLLRHRAAYQEAIRIALASGAHDILEMGSGTGYGTRELAAALPSVVAVDRVAPLATGPGVGPGEGPTAIPTARPAPGSSHAARFLRADLESMPLSNAAFDLVVSFQVIEHLTDPANYLDALARHLRDDGVALVTTPNRANSDGENPFHVHEYDADELRSLLATRFESVEMRGLFARGEAHRYHEERLRRIRRIVRIDPLGFRKQIPRPLVEWIFARLARVVRRGIAAGDGISGVRIEDFPIEPIRPDCLDLFAVCRRPRR